MAVGQARWCPARERGGERPGSLQEGGLAEVGVPGPVGEAPAQKQEKAEEMVRGMGGNQEESS